MKKPVTQFDLAAAFKALDEIEYGKVESNPVKNSKKLKESLLRETCEKITSRKLNIERLVEDYYNLDDEQDLVKAADDREAEIAQAKLARIEKIVDLDAQTADDLLDSYVGKVIVRCPQCMNMFYKNEEDIVKDEEDPTICNINEPCQHCGNISGYEIIGKVDKLSPEDTAQLSGEEEAPTDSEENLDLDLDVTEEEAPAEEGEATEEGADEDLDLDLDLDLDEPAQESLNASKAAKSNFESKNATENKTLNEDVDKDVKELDDKLKAHNDYIEYLKNEIVSANEALEKATNDEVKAAIQRKLDTLNDDLAAALPDAVKNDTTPNEVTADDITETEDVPAEEKVTEESLNKAKAAKSDFESENNSEEAKSLNEDLTEANKYGRPDEDDYYAQDINDAVIQLKKKGHAEFWCRQGKDKADEVVKLFHDRYGKKAEYTIDDEYCTAKVVKEDLKEDTDQNHIKQITDYLNRVKNSFDKEFTDKEKMACHPDGNGLMQVVDIYIKKHPEDEGNNLGGDDAFLDLFDKILYDHVLNEVTKTAKVVKEDLHEDVASILNSFAASLDDDNFEAPIEDSVEESVNKAEADVNTISENESENKSINEGDDNCEGCKKSTCKSKVKDNLDEAVAITISVDEIDDQVMANGPADTMIVAEPEATAIYDQPVYDQPEFPVVEVEPQEIENPFEQEFETPADFVGEYKDYSDADDIYATNEADAEDDDESDDDDSDDETNNVTPTEEKDADNKEDNDDDDDDGEEEEVEESLQEGIFDKVKGAASKVGGAVKNTFVSINSRLDKGFEDFQVETKYNDSDPDIKHYANFEQAKQAAIASSNLGNATQAKVLAKSKVNGQITLIDGYVKGKQAGKGKTAYVSALKTADGTAAINNSVENKVKKPDDLDSTDPSATAETTATSEPVDATKPVDTDTAKPADTAKPTTSTKDTAAAKARAKYRKVLNLLADAGIDISGLTTGGKVNDKLRNLVKGLDSTNESLTEDIESATDEAVAKLQQLADDGTAAVETPEPNVPEANETPVQEVPATPEPQDETTVEEPVEEGILSAVGNVVNGVVDGAKELLADNANDKNEAEDVSIADQINASNHVGEEKPAGAATEESLEEDANGVSDAEFEQMLNSKTFQDFNEEIDIDDIEDIDEKSVNECTTNYLKEVYSNVDKFELTKADVVNNVLVLEGLIKFHSGNTRNTTFGYNLATGKQLTFSGINEDLAKNGQFNIKCSLTNKSLVVESLSYKHEVNGQLVEGLVHKN